MDQRDALQVKRVLTYQGVLTVALSFLALPFGLLTSLSALIGAGACLVANGIFALMAFRAYRASEPARLVLRFYSAELIKIGLVLLIFLAAFLALDRLNLVVLLGAYFAVQVIPTLVAAQMPERTTK